MRAGSSPLRVVATFVVPMTLAALGVASPIACSKATPTTTSVGFDVYVPMPVASDASAPFDAAEAGFGLGQVDRAGRPLVSTLLLPSSLQDLYNEQPSFIDASAPRVLQDAVESRLVELDTLILGRVLGGVLDGGDEPDPVDWPVPEGGTHPLLPMLVGDMLLVDTALSCTIGDAGFARSYLDIEKEAFSFGTAQVHTTCGGRTPNEPVVDETLTLLITAGREGGPPVTQGVDSATQSATTAFPYFAPPN